uniref:Uncharacterized protein n=1 Tax=Knipowitschia caucasica TaxID=637954 RepID=A0AAV2MS27_KNICA
MCAAEILPVGCGCGRSGGLFPLSLAHFTLGGREESPRPPHASSITLLPSPAWADVVESKSHVVSTSGPNLSASPPPQRAGSGPNASTRATITFVSFAAAGAWHLTTEGSGLQLRSTLKHRLCTGYLVSLGTALLCFTPRHHFKHFPVSKTKEQIYRETDERGSVRMRRAFT